MNNYERDHSHSHCWESKQPPCGQKIEHLKCCLCEKPNPKSQDGMNTDGWKFKLDDEVYKVRGSEWRGTIVGFYSTTTTPRGYAIESHTYHGTVQIYPEAALELVK